MPPRLVSSRLGADLRYLKLLDTLFELRPSFLVDSVFWIREAFFGFGDCRTRYRIAIVIMSSEQTPQPTGGEWNWTIQSRRVGTRAGK